MLTVMLSDLEDMATATSWMSRGRCAEIDPELFFPNPGQPSTTANTVCQTCPVQATCFAYAVHNGIEYGVWGGMSMFAYWNSEREDLHPLRLAA